jgi:E3 ubiquitin-protein ligase UHRF1
VVAKALKSLKVKSKRDWGSGKSVAGVANRFCVVPDNHFGRIPGVPSGRLWDTRLTVRILFNALYVDFEIEILSQVSRYGVHRPPVAGISGKLNQGVVSVCFSGGYPGDYDHGHEFLMSGSGGRDLSGNKRTEKQSKPQELTRSNLYGLAKKLP